MLVTKTAFAKSQGFSQPYVSYLINKGHVIPVDGKIDTEQAEAALAAIRKPGRRLFRKGLPEGLPEGGAQGQGPSQAAELSTFLLKTRIKNEVEKGKLLEVEAKVKTGQYVDIQAVEKEAFQAARSVRDALQNIPARVASLLASLSDSNEIYEILAKEIRTALEGLAETLGAL